VSCRTGSRRSSPCRLMRIRQQTAADLLMSRYGMHWLAGWQRRRWLAWGTTVPPHDGWHILNGRVRNGRCCKRTATGLAGRGGRTAASSVQGARRGGVGRARS
jgi:hypothetical protein